MTKSLKTVSIIKGLLNSLEKNILDSAIKIGGSNYYVQKGKLYPTPEFKGSVGTITNGIASLTRVTKKRIRKRTASVPKNGSSSNGASSNSSINTASLDAGILESKSDISSISDTETPSIQANGKSSSNGNSSANGKSSSSNKGSANNKSIKNTTGNSNSSVTTAPKSMGENNSISTLPKD